MSHNVSSTHNRNSRWVPGGFHFKRLVDEADFVARIPFQLLQQWAVLQNELDDIAAAGAYRLPQGQAEVKGFLVLQKKQLGLRVKCFSVRQEKGRTQLPRPLCQTHF